MMDTKELMIGNYVIRHTGEITKVLEVLTDRVTIKGDGYKTIKSLTIPAKSISPIILKVEHLLKFGFKAFDKDFYKRKIIIHSRKRGFVINRRTPIIETVHQLQNYYYLHTKEHLIYSINNQ